MGGGGGLWGGLAGMGGPEVGGRGSERGSAETLQGLSRKVRGRGGGVCGIRKRSENDPRGSVPGIRKRSDDPTTIRKRSENDPGSENDPKDFRTFLDPPNPPGPASGCRRVLELVREGGIRASL